MYYVSAHIDGLTKEGSISIAKVLEILRSCIKPSISDQSPHFVRDLIDIIRQHNWKYITDQNIFSLSITQGHASCQNEANLESPKSLTNLGREQMSAPGSGGDGGFDGDVWTGTKN